MADCPGVLHLAAMADGALARLRVPGGRLDADQLRAVAKAADDLGSGVVDLTSRANLQIRGLDAGDGPALARRLEEVGLFADGPADRRRNILLDPLSGLDPEEVRDLRGLAAALGRALAAAPWIEGLSPKFSFVLDGGGGASVRAVASDVAVLADPAGLRIACAGAAVSAATDAAAVAALVAIAETAAAAGPDARARDLDAATLLDRLATIEGIGSADAPAAARLRPVFGAFPTDRDGRPALVLPVAVGRLNRAMLDGAAALAERRGDGTVALAPWSAIVAPGVREAEAGELLALSEAVGFLPVGVAERLQVAACAGAPACERAREPARALALDLLAAAAAAPERLPLTARRVHLSACPKGCAGSAAADLLLLGSSEEGGWSLHRDGSPRSPGVCDGRLDEAGPRDLLDRIAALG